MGARPLVSGSRLASKVPESTQSTTNEKMQRHLQLSPVHATGVPKLGLQVPPLALEKREAAEAATSRLLTSRSTRIPRCTIIIAHSHLPV